MSVIDLSTPESLERDFYAWLKGENGSDSESAREATNEKCAFAELLPMSPFNEFSPLFDEHCQFSPVPPPTCLTPYSSPKISGAIHLDYDNNGQDQNFDLNSRRRRPKQLSKASSYSSFTTSFESSLSVDSKDPVSDQIESPSTTDESQIESRFRTIKLNGRLSATNQLGGSYSPGQPLSMADRERIVQLHQQGWRISQISKHMFVTHSCVSKILKRFKLTNSVSPRKCKETRAENPLVEIIRDYHARLGLTRQRKIREQLILDRIYAPDDMPSRSTINHILRTKLNLTIRAPKNVVETGIESAPTGLDP